MSKGEALIPSAFFDEFRTAFRERFPTVDATIATCGGVMSGPAFVRVETTKGDPSDPEGRERFRAHREIGRREIEIINRKHQAGESLRPMAEGFVDMIASFVEANYPGAWADAGPARRIH
jgi:hypothetical protein